MANAHETQQTFLRRKNAWNMHILIKRKWNFCLNLNLGLSCSLVLVSNLYNTRIWRIPYVSMEHHSSGIGYSDSKFGCNAHYLDNYLAAPRPSKCMFSSAEIPSKRLPPWPNHYRRSTTLHPSLCLPGIKRMSFN